MIFGQGFPLAGVPVSEEQAKAGVQIRTKRIGTQNFLSRRRRKGIKNRQHQDSRNSLAWCSNSSVGRTTPFFENL